MSENDLSIGSNVTGALKKFLTFQISNAPNLLKIEMQKENITLSAMHLNKRKCKWSERKNEMNSKVAKLVKYDKWWYIGTALLCTSFHYQYILAVFHVNWCGLWSSGFTQFKGFSCWIIIHQGFLFMNFYTFRPWCALVDLACTILPPS